MTDFSPAGFLAAAKYSLLDLASIQDPALKQGLIRTAISRAYYAAFLSAYKHLSEKDDCPLVVFDDAVDIGSYNRKKSNDLKIWAGQALGTRYMEQIWKWKYQKGSHQFIIRAFISKQKARGTVNTLLDALYTMRILADYRLRRETPESDAKEACNLAQQVIEALAQLPKDHCKPCDDCLALESEYLKSLQRK